MKIREVVVNENHEIIYLSENPVPIRKEFFYKSGVSHYEYYRGLEFVSNIIMEDIIRDNSLGLTKIRKYYPNGKLKSLYFSKLINFKGEVRTISFTTFYSEEGILINSIYRIDHRKYFPENKKKLERLILPSLLLMKIYYGVNSMRDKLDLVNSIIILNNLK